MAYFDTLKTVRENAGIRISTLARKAGLDRGTVSRVESHHNSTPETLNALINALNDLYYLNKGYTISYVDVVTEISRYGGKA